MRVVWGRAFDRGLDLPLNGFERFAGRKGERRPDDADVDIGVSVGIRDFVEIDVLCSLLIHLIAEGQQHLSATQRNRAFQERFTHGRAEKCERYLAV